MALYACDGFDSHTLLQKFTCHYDNEREIVNMEFEMLIAYAKSVVGCEEHRALEVVH